MSGRAWRAIRGVIIGAGATVMIAAALLFRVDDWPIYAAFALLLAVLLPLHVDVLPNLVLPMPSLAVTIGFLYIGGLPILLVYQGAYYVALIVLRLLRAALPEPWRSRLPYPVGGGTDVFALPSMLRPGERLVAAAEHSTFTLGLAARLLVVRLLAPEGRPASHPGAMAAAEVAGYVCWGILSSLPILRFQTGLGAGATDRPRAVYQDLGLIMIFALTPFVFLIAQGYVQHGLAGAVVWSLSALALHFTLQRLNERRILVEQQNARLAALNRELEHRERLSAIGKMSSVVSHQMLQQIGVIGIHADLIRNTPADADPRAAVAQAQANAAAIEDALGSVNRVLTDLLVFSRDLRLNLYAHRLDDLLAGCIAECSPAAAARGVRLRLVCAPDVMATVDKLKMKQAVVNLVRNAIEASPADAEVVVRGALDDGWAEIAVTDRGPGVPDADRDAVFTPFFTTKEHGTGLGLAIASEFTAAHGGRIVLAVANGTSGATFVVRLPVAGPPVRAD
jgi:signal transduction histidine kinase